MGFDNQQAVRPVILVVDDAPPNLELIGGLLGDAYKIRVATSGERALAMLDSAPLPDLVLLDVMMPGISGWDVCRAFKRHPRWQDVPVIFMTARNEPEDEKIGLGLGAVDYITKPVSAPILLARVATHLKLKAASDFLRNNNAFLQAEVERRAREVTAIQEVTILAMASIAEARDNETGNHIRRTQHYIETLATDLRSHPRFADYLTPERTRLLYASAPLHDIGKVGIPDRILQKNGRLDVEEFEVMKTHTRIGHDAIAVAEQALGVEASFLRCAMEIALCHHEKWDGSGYPQGLRGDQIPVSARLMALADVYDALVSRRYYKAAHTHEEAAAMIRAGSGTHFDPDIVQAFARNEQTFRAIAECYADP